MTAASPGQVALVGAGPGDAELLTRKAVRAIRNATVVLADDLVSDAVLRFVRRSARVVHVGKRGGCASTPQAFIEKLMAAEALKGERVVRLKGGDPSLFGRLEEELQALAEHGIDCEVVPGVTAALAAAAASQRPLTRRGRGRSGPGRRRPDLAWRQRPVRPSARPAGAHPGSGGFRAAARRAHVLRRHHRPGVARGRLDRDP